MKKVLFTIIFLTSVICSFAQPRAVGVRVGVSGVEASYEHNIRRTQFIEGNLGLDFGHNANGQAGIKAECTYNFIWARPAWTNKGTWALYAGPGAALGFVNDDVHFKIGKNVVSYMNNGFMLGISGQVGIEYTFEFPLQLSIDLRPVFGIHVTGKHEYTDPVNSEITHKDKVRVGYYDNGILGLVPSVSIRYRF